MQHVVNCIQIKFAYKTTPTRIVNNKNKFKKKNVQL